MEIRLISRKIENEKGTDKALCAYRQFLKDNPRTVPSKPPSQFDIVHRFKVIVHYDSMCADSIDLVSIYEMNDYPTRDLYNRIVADAFDFGIECDLSVMSLEIEDGVYVDP